MCKISKIIKYMLLILLLILISMFIYRFYIKYPFKVTGIEFQFSTIIMFALLLILYVINVIDLFKTKYKVVNESKYNLITIIGLIPILTVFFRIMFDNTLIANLSGTFAEEQFLLKEGHTFIEYNSFIIIIIIMLLIIYRSLNIKKI